MDQAPAHVTLAAANSALEPIVRQICETEIQRLPDHWHLALQPIICTFQQNTGRTLTLLFTGVVLPAHNLHRSHSS